MSPLPASFCLLLFLLCTMSLSAMSFFMLKEQEEYGYDIRSGKGDGAKKQKQGSQQARQNRARKQGTCIPRCGMAPSFASSSPSAMFLLVLPVFILPHLM